MSLVEGFVLFGTHQTEPWLMPVSRYFPNSLAFAVEWAAGMADPAAGGFARDTSDLSQVLARTTQGMAPTRMS